MNTKKIIGLIISLAALSVLFFTARHAIYYAPDTEVAVPAETRVMSASSGTSVGQDAYPEKLEIPALGINTDVQHVGVKPNGNMANPNNFTDVGWYKLGTVPGQPGSAVMAGHVDNGLALAGVFKHLGDIKVGDDVYVTDKSGNRLHFVVTKTASYPYDNAPAKDIFTSSDGKAHLNLITCTGDWIANQKTYSERLVVYTTLAR